MQFKQKQNYSVITPNGEKVFTMPGKNGERDMKIFSEFPKQPWPHSLFYIGLCLRLKGEIEDRNYPPKNGFKGREMLLEFCQDCLYRLDLNIFQICKKYKIF